MMVASFTRLDISCSFRSSPVRLIAAMPTQFRVCSSYLPAPIDMILVTLSKTMSVSSLPTSITSVLMMVVPFSEVMIGALLSSSAGGTSGPTIGSSLSLSQELKTSKKPSKSNDNLYIFITLRCFIDKCRIRLAGHPYLLQGNSVLTGANTSIASVSPTATNP